MISRLLEYSETVDINDYYHRYVRNGAGSKCDTSNITNDHEWGIDKSEDILNAKCDKERMIKPYLFIA